MEEKEIPKSAYGSITGGETPATPGIREQTADQDGKGRPVEAENTSPGGGEPISNPTASTTPHIEANPENKENPKPPQHAEGSDEVPS